MKKRFKPFIRFIAVMLIITAMTPMDALAATYVIGASGNPGTGGSQHNSNNTGLIAMAPSFRVGLSRDPLGAPLTANDPPGTFKTRLETQYVRRYPDNGYRADNWPITFLPQGHQGTANMFARGVRYTKYNPSSGELISYNDPNVAANTMICSATRLTGNTGVYFNQLRTQLGSWRWPN